MATTKIWPIHGNLSSIIGYITNPEKTGKEYSEIYNVLHYMTNEKKTAVPNDGQRERTLFVTSLNIKGDPVEAMRRTEKYFGKTDGVTIYHAYQSFKPGEVSPEQCHEIGVKLARQMWGDKYQAVVTSHLDHAHLHNHFAICSVSFVNGKKYNENIGEYHRIRDASDALCREYGLSVIELPQNKTPRQIHEREKKGEPTKYSMMASAMHKAMKISTSWEDFCHHLYNAGYDFDPNFDGKYAKIKRISEEKWTRIYHCGEDFYRAHMEFEFNTNAQNKKPNYRSYYRIQRYENRNYVEPRHEYLHELKLNRMPLLLGIVLQFIYLCGGPDLIGHTDPCPKYTPITPEMIEARRFLEQVSRQAVIMGREHLETKGDVDAYLDKLEGTIVEQTKRRNKLYNKIRNCKDEGEIAGMREEIHTISAKLKPIRKEQKDLEALLVRSGEMEEQVRAEDAARHRKLWREYNLPDELEKRWENDLYDGYVPLNERYEPQEQPEKQQPAPIIKAKSKTRDDAR